MKPLYRPTAARKLVWSAKYERAFSEVKKALTEAPVLSYPDFSEDCRLTKFIVTYDASSTGSGAVLSRLRSFWHTLELPSMRRKRDISAYRSRTSGDTFRDKSLEALFIWS